MTEHVCSLTRVHEVGSRGCDWRVWSYTLAEWEARQRRRERLRLVGLTVGLVVLAAATLFMGWLLAVGFLVTFS